MAFPIHESLGTPASTSYGTNVTPSIPPAVVAGDTLLAIVAADANRTITTPTGWTALPVQTYTTNLSIYTYIRTSDGSDVDPTFTLDVGTEPMYAIIARITGYNSHTIISSAQNTTSLTFPANGTAPADALVYRILAFDGGPDPTLVMPATNVLDDGTGAGSNDIWVGISHENIAKDAAIPTNSATVAVADNTVLVTLSILAVIDPTILNIDGDNVLEQGQNDVTINFANNAGWTGITAVDVGGSALSNIRFTPGEQTALVDVPAGATLTGGDNLNVTYTE